MNNEVINTQDIQVINETPSDGERRMILSVRRDFSVLDTSINTILEYISKDNIFSQNGINSIELATTEGLVNAIKQPPQSVGEDGDRIIIQVVVNDEFAEISIHDFGKGFDISKAAEPDFSKHPESGYGIFLMKKSMDSVDYIKKNKENILVMKKNIANAANEGERETTHEKLNILIVDDDEYLRAILSRYLVKQGHKVMEAEDAASAFSILTSRKIQIVISDWIMPKEDGIQFCKRVRNHDFHYYIYFILLTSKNTQEDIITGLEAGADDFIAKPFNREELKVKIRSGERVINLEKDLAIKNNNLKEANKKIEEAYLRMRYDLEQAAKFQNKLLPEKENHFLEDMKFDWIFLPSDFVAGDLFNYYQINDEYAAFYLFDVAGHGVSSAMLSFTLNRELFPNKNISGLIYRASPDGAIGEILSPSKTISSLNRLYYTEAVDFQFFTIFYGLFNRKTKEVIFVQAGHPPAVLIKEDGSHVLLSSEGPAIGIFKNIIFTEKKIQVETGDRLYIYSDGVTECLNRQGDEFSEERLIEALKKTCSLELEEVLYILKMDLIEWSDGKSFGDDITLLGIEFK